MGNKLGRKRHVVDEKYTRPQGLYHIKDVDMKKLRKLILEAKLAPCYPGDEECCYEFEECPICFLFYPSLNRSKCCMKGICTECFLQMKTPNSTRPTQCPFCKTSNYAVEYRGMKTKEEKGIEQIEEQRVIEAKIRMRQQELEDDKERMHKRQEISSSLPLEVEYSPVAVPSSSSTVEVDEIISSQEFCASPVTHRPPNPRMNRDDEADVDLEDIMIMEALWLSIQENGRHRNTAYVDTAPSELYVTDRYASPAMVAPVTSSSSSSPSGGLACAIAALAERQQTGGESSISLNGHTVVSNMPPGSSRFRNRVERHAGRYSPAESPLETSPPDDRMAVMTRDDREWNGSEMAEAGTSYASSDTTDDVMGMAPADDSEGNFLTVPGPVVPETFEEQMMLAMAVSLAEARAVTSRQGVAWQ